MIERRYRRLLGYLRPYRWAFAVSLGTAAVASVFDGFMFALLIPLLRVLFGGEAAAVESPTLVERVLDDTAGRFLLGNPETAIRNIGLLILTAAILKNVAAYVSAYLNHTMQEGVVRDLRTELYDHMQRLGLAFFESKRSGQLVARMFSDIEEVKLLFQRGLHTVVRQGVVVVVYLGILVVLSWRLTLLTILLAPTIGLLFKPLLLRIRRLMRASVEARGDMTAIFMESVAGARLVKTHAAETYERGRFLNVMRRYVADRLAAERLAVAASPLSEMMGTGVVVLLLVAGSWLVGPGDAVRPELMIAYLAVALRLLSPVKYLAQFPAIVAQTVVSAQRVFDVLDVPPDDVDQPETRDFPGLRQTIEFGDVWFAYRDDDWVLRGVDLSVQRGEVVALVGPSGAGKSTLLDLLPRFIDPVRGHVRLDGVPTTTYRRSSLRHAFGIVSQETTIFNDTVAANIAYGDPHATPDAVEAAARAANAHEFIHRLPEGYGTQLGERGAQLSGGERQRIAIARALLRDPPILILDEATSALDTESERLVQEAVDRLVRNRTVLVVAHRLSTIARADTIAVMDRGRIVETGRHADLVAAGGRYQQLHAAELALIRR